MKLKSSLIWQIVSLLSAAGSHVAVVPVKLRIPVIIIAGLATIALHVLQAYCNPDGTKCELPYETPAERKAVEQYPDNL